MFSFGSILSYLSNQVMPQKPEIKLIIDRIHEKAREAATKGERRAEYVLLEDKDKLNEDFIQYENDAVLIAF